MKLAGIGILLTIMMACTADKKETPRPDIVATNAFYYYEDVEAAWAFYRDKLGFETVVDYGFAKIMRLADSSYLTLVRASEGMHSADEPKTVTLSLVTDELNRWHEHLVEQDVQLVDAPDEVADHFVAVDPEGYFLKFVRFNPHPNHESFVAAFADARPLAAHPQDAPGPVSVRVTAFSLYFDNLVEVRPFYESLFALKAAGTLGGLPAYPLSGSGFLVLVEGDDELLGPTDEAGVTLSVLTSDIDGWFARAADWPGFELRTEEILNEGERVRVFVGYDPAGIFLEWDTFLAVPENERLLDYLP